MWLTACSLILALAASACGRCSRGEDVSTVPQKPRALLGDDAAGDAPPPAIDLATAWTRRTIYNGNCVGSTQCSGADGVDYADVDGDGLPDAVAPWEQSSRVSISIHPTSNVKSPWVTVIPSCTVSAIEDARIADVDGNGRPDVVVAGDAGQKITVLFQPVAASFYTPSAWTCVALTASNTTPAKENWIQIAFADVDGDGVKDIVAAGRTTGSGAGYLQGRIGYFTNPTGAWTTGTAYVWHEIGLGGVVWSLVPMDVDGDGDLDLVVSDGNSYVSGGVTISTLMGSRWLENPRLPSGGSTWTNHTIHVYNGAGQLARFLHAESGRVIDGSSRDTGTSFVNVRATSDWTTWTSTAVMWPASGVGHYNAVRPADLDGDGCEDLVFSTHHADSDYFNPPQDLSGVFWYRGDCVGGWTRGEISGVDGVKYDNVELYDVDGDGDLDVLTTEQGMAGVTPAADKLGLIWYENPRIP